MAELGKSVLKGEGITKVFGYGKTRTVAVDHVDFDFREGEVISIVGESGSGKTTIARMILGLIGITEGSLEFNGQPRDISSGKKRKEYWKNIQAVFQDPFSSFNMFNKIDDLLLDCINMQRLMIARIFLLKPKILIADEPTSMVDACSRATILDMLLKLRDEINMTIIFITHDIGLAYYVSDTVYIMEHGKFVEAGSAEDVIIHPQAAYTRRLISDVPKIYGEWDLSTVGD